MSASLAVATALLVGGAAPASANVYTQGPNIDGNFALYRNGTQIGICSASRCSLFSRVNVP